MIHTPIYLYLQQLEVELTNQLNLKSVQQPAPPATEDHWEAWPWSLKIGQQNGISIQCTSTGQTW